MLQLPLSPVQKITHPLFEKAKINVFIKRDDLIHPIISGNKWRKLQGNIHQAKKQHKTGIISFGGAYSNHIHALAYACKTNKLSCIGIIRGEKHYQSNYTLSWAKKWGMSLHFVDRLTYKKRDELNYTSQLQQQYPQHLIVPEGGTNTFALSGVGEVINELNQQSSYDTLMLPVGSGGTISGLIKADNNAHRILGICVLKSGGYLTKTIKTLVNDNALIKWSLLTDYHRGGYAKFNRSHWQKILDFSQLTQIPFEPVYSGKMLLALLDLVEAGHFEAGHNIMLLHTGGIQGLGGLLERKLITPLPTNEPLWHLPSAPQAQ